MRPESREIEFGFGGVELERAAFVPRLEQRDRRPRVAATCR
jgi:hypothetical protein